MAKHLRMDAWVNSSPNIDGLQWQVFSTALAEGDYFEDLWQPSFWKHFSTGTKELSVGDIVRVRGNDGSFDIFLTIEEKIPGGLKIEFLFGRLPVEFKGAHAADLKGFFERDETQFDVVKLDPEGKPYVRVELMPTGWRVIGDDSGIVATELKSKSIADNKLQKYLFDMRLRMPNPSEMQEHKREQENRMKEQSAAIAAKQGGAKSKRAA